MTNLDITEIDCEDLRRMLDEISRTYMPFGIFGKEKYPPRGRPIYDLPENYLMWFKQRTFPQGRLGELMAQVCELKEAGLDHIFDPMRKRRPRK